MVGYDFIYFNIGFADSGFQSLSGMFLLEGQILRLGLTIGRSLEDKNDEKIDITADKEFLLEILLEKCETEITIHWEFFVMNLSLLSRKSKNHIQCQFSFVCCV